MYRQGFEPPISRTAGEHYTKKILWQLLPFAIQNLNIHGLIPGRENKLKCGIIGNKLFTAFTGLPRIALASDAPWISGTCKPECLNQVGVTTYAETWLDLSIMHPERAETDISGPGFEPPISCTATAGHSTIELSRQVMLFANWNLCNMFNYTVLYSVAH